VPWFAVVEVRQEGMARSAISKLCYEIINSAYFLECACAEIRSPFDVRPCSSDSIGELI